MRISGALEQLDGRYRQLARRLKYGDVHVRDVKALQNLSSLNVGYLPWTGSALRPSTCEQLLNDVFVNERKVIVEFGAGISTVLLAALDRQFDLGLTLYSVDESDEWLELVERRVERIGSNTRFTPIHAELRSLESDQVGRELVVSRWYSSQALAMLPGTNIDLVICDGPTAYQSRTQFDRWPALPKVYAQLSQRCAVLLDDTYRSGETAVADDWSTRYPDLRRRPHATCTWFTRGAYWNA